MKITVETQVSAPISKVWQDYTSPEAITQWNAASADWHTTRARVDLREGGHFSSRMEAKDGSMGFDFEGTYTKVVEHSLLEYTFGERTAQVEFIDGDSVTVRVSFDSEDSHSIEQQRDGWQSILDSFKRYVESVTA
ncbi:SRPBCC family protein [Microbulbifer sp. SAOS-129_SWC]|uniref:SRPBCC family protein n=1 Tax=Microbulbifer sp. SAOS-129_SWC TaxID=3145235 RepID=UPI00321804CD